MSQASSTDIYYLFAISQPCGLADGSVRMADQVHDRDAKPQPQGFVPAAPKPVPVPPQKGKAGKTAVKAPAATPKTPSSKVETPVAADTAAAAAAAQPVAPAEAASE